MPPRAIRAVLFDLDGVLIDSFEMWLGVLNDVAARLGCPAVSPAALEATFGQGVAADARTFYPGTTYEALRAAYQEAMPHHADRIVADGGARELLDDLGRRGVGRAVVTNTQQSAVRGILDRVGLLDACDVIAGTRPGVREKPAPDLLLDACRQLGVPPTAALMVGDTDYDARAAAAAGTAYVHYETRGPLTLAGAVGGALDETGVLE